MEILDNHQPARVVIPTNEIEIDLDAAAADPGQVDFSEIDRIADLAARDSAAAWEIILSAGSELRGAENRTQWKTGMLATMIDKRYGETAALIEQFAKQCDIAVSTVRERRRVCQFFTRADLDDMQAEFGRLPYSIFRLAVRFSKHKDYKDNQADAHDAALAFVSACIAEDYSYERAKTELADILGSPKPPRKLLEMSAKLAVIEQATATNRMTLTFEIMSDETPAGVQNALKIGDLITMIVKEIGGDDDQPEITANEH